MGSSFGGDSNIEENTSADLFNESNVSASATAAAPSTPSTPQDFSQPAEEEKEEEEEVPAGLNPAAALALRKAKKRRNTIRNDKNMPHITNLNEDPQMSGIVFTSAQKGEILIGRKTADPQPDIILGAIGIQRNHAKITLKANGLFELTVVAEAAISTFINGEPLTV